MKQHFENQSQISQLSLCPTMPDDISHDALSSIKIHLPLFSPCQKSGTGK
jgi:hypothetical protein